MKNLVHTQDRETERQTDRDRVKNNGGLGMVQNI